jgi:hypothetical protein
MQAVAMQARLKRDQINCPRRQARSLALLTGFPLQILVAGTENETAANTVGPFIKAKASIRDNRP